jgi:putative transposase
MVAKEVMSEHVHLFGRVGLADAPVSVVRAFTGRTARVLRAEFRYLRRLEMVVWSPSYLAASADDVWESTVRGDVEPRWDAVA